MSSITPFNDTDPPLTIVSEYSISRKSTAVYIIIILIAILFFASLLLINSPVKVKGQALFPHRLIRSELLAPVNGTITEVFVKKNQKVGKGDIVLLIKVD